MKREIINKVKGFGTIDGAGVNLVRVLGNETVDIYDPILMLDSFDSINPSDYTKGFPMHPHRGIETISLIVEGKMIHKDSLGNEEEITNGEVQWMTAGSGIFHEELLPESKRMLGIQLWLNLPQKDKMVKPKYHSIKKDEIKEIEIENGLLRLISGEYKNYKGYLPKYSPLDMYHIILDKNSNIKIDTAENKSVMIFTLLGSVKINGEIIEEKTAVKFSSGDFLEINSLNDETQIVFISSDRLGEGVAWGGPIVMNTKQELQIAFKELDLGTFLKEKIDY